MTQSSVSTPNVASARPPRRDTGTAVKRGLRGRCPACGDGPIFGKYLKVQPTCPACGEELHHHRADDFPAYLTIFVVGHVVGAMFMAVDEFWPNVPTWFHYVTWPVLCILFSLWLLPILKGGLVAYQWALRMHGFEGPAASSDEAAAPALRPSPVT